MDRSTDRGWSGQKQQREGSEVGGWPGGGQRSAQPKQTLLIFLLSPEASDEIAKLAEQACFGQNCRNFEIQKLFFSAEILSGQSKVGRIRQR